MIQIFKNKIQVINCKLKVYLNAIQLPLLGIGLYDFLEIFFKGLLNGMINIRAAAVAYSLFISLFPFLMFLFALLPHLQLYDSLDLAFQRIIINAFPEKAFNNNGVSYQDELLNALSIFRKKDNAVLSTSVILSIIFTTNGMNALIGGFNISIHAIERRGFFYQYFRALLLTLLFTSFFIILLIILYKTSELSDFIKTGNWEMITNYSENIRYGFGITTFFSFFFIALVLLYRIGPKTHLKWKEVIPGAILATVLFFLVFIFFTLYLKYFSKYQTLYNSIGVFIVLLLWIYLSVNVILIGFEFNVSIGVAKKSGSKLNQIEC